MPEGDTVWRAAQNLHAALTGRVLTRCDVRVPAYATVDLAGERVDEVASRGKHLFVRVGRSSIHSHLKMDGSWHLYSPHTRWRRPAFQARIVLGTRDRVAVGFLLGVLEVLDRDAEDTVVGHLGPDLLGPGWDAPEAVRRLEREPRRSISEALLDQQTMAGIGNLYRNELCFVRGLHPATAVGASGDLDRLVTQAYLMLQANKLRSARSTTGDVRPGREVWVYGRGGQPCRRCGSPIRRAEAGPVDRVTYWCPHCQPERG